MAEEVLQTDERLSVCEKRLKTVFLVLVWVCLGLTLEVTGPTLIDLKIRSGADYEAVAVAVSGRSAGYFIGSAIGGVLVDRFGGRCDLMIAISLTGVAAATVCVPWFRLVQLIWFMIVIQGTFEGIINIAGQKVIINLWKDRAASPLHILHGGFGIGSFIIPMIANPFLAVPKPILSRNTSMLSKNESQNGSIVSQELLMTQEKKTDLHFSNETDTNITYTNNIEYLKESRIEFAYLIAAVITLAVSAVFYFYHIKERHKDLKDEEVSKELVAKDAKAKWHEFFKEAVRMVNPATCANGKLLYGAQIFGLLFLYFVNIVGGERILGKFIRAFAIEQRGFSVYNGSYINTIFWLSFAVGRFSGFLFARWIPIRTLILLETAGIFVTSVLMNIFAADFDIALWILTAVLGFFHAPGFPSGIGWGNYHVEMTGMAITFLLLGGSIGGIIYLRITGILFETYGARAFLHHVMAYGIAAFGFALLMTCVGAQNGNRYSKSVKTTDSVIAGDEEKMEINSSDEETQER